MRSTIVGRCGEGVKRLSRFASNRPWLCGAAALAVATSALFAWFCGERWDQVDVATAVPRTRPVPAAAQPPFHAALQDATPAETSTGLHQGPLPADATSAPDMSDFESFNTRERITFRSAARPRTVEVSFPAAAAGPTGTRGAWLLGTIEEIDDDLYHAHGGAAWPGLAGRPESNRW